VKVFGQAAIAKFTRKHAAARKPMTRFLTLALAANWPHFPAVTQSFPAADYAPATGTIIFDIGGNKYRVIAVVNFEEQAIFIRSVLTHEEYSREKL
jgi:mRNA interferase HigB